MTFARRTSVLAFVAVLGSAVACTEDDAATVPVRPAPPSRHGALVDALAEDARAFAFENGDWTEDLGDAPFYGLAWLSRRAAAGRLDADGVARRDAALVHAKTLLTGNLLEGDVQDRVMAALGVIEYVNASGDRSVVPLLDDLVDRLDTLTRTLGDYVDVGTDRSWALRTYGPTAVTALIALVEAQYVLLVGGPRASERLERVRAIDAKIKERALTDLVDAPSGRSVRAYAFGAGKAGLYDYPNLAVLLLKARLFRLTKEEAFRLEARAIFAALQPLKLSDTPARYASPYARSALGIEERDLSTLSSQNYLALGLLLLFEITGDQRFVDEADRVLDAVEAMRGRWCTSHVHDGGACAPACAAGEACSGGACAADRCTTGLLHHVVKGRLALPEDGTLFCAGCTLQTLYVAGYRRMLAGEGY